MISLLNNEKQSEDLKRHVREGNKLFLHSKRNMYACGCPFAMVLARRRIHGNSGSYWQH
jgi:hypothetical protein